MSALPAAPIARSATPLREHAPCLLLLVVMLASIPWLVLRGYEANVETNDASMYLASAQALLRGEGYAYLGVPFTIRPPGMSLVVAPLIAWRGLDFTALHTLGMLFGVACAFLVQVWMRPVLGAWCAAALAACLWFNPGFQHYANQVMSDVPGAAFLVAILIVERWAAHRPSWRRDACLGLLIGAATYMRTIAVLALSAVLVARVLEHVFAHGSRTAWLDFLRERVLVLVVATLVVAAPWSVRNALVQSPPPADQNFIHSYGTGLLHTDPGDPNSPLRPLGDVVDLAGPRAIDILSALGARLEGRGADGPTWIFGCLVTAAVAWRLVRKRGAAELLYFQIVFVLLVYFGFRARLVLPLYVIGLACTTELALACVARRWPISIARASVALALVALTVVDFQPRKGHDEIVRRHAERMEQARALNAALPPEAKVAARIGWHLALDLERPVHSLRFAVDRRARAGVVGGEAQIVAGIEDMRARHALDYVIVGSELAERAWLPVLERRFGPGRAAGTAWIFALGEPRTERTR